MEILSRMLDRGATEQRLCLHPKCESPLITHLTFADDVMIFTTGDAQSLVHVKEILATFSGYSGLHLNMAKTEIFLGGMTQQEASDLSASLGIQVGTLPVRYLEVPLSHSRMSKSDYQPLLDRIKAKLTSWTTKKLSYAERIQLISSVIYDLVNAWGMVFLLLKYFMKQVDSLCSGFLWSGSLDAEQRFQGKGFLERSSSPRFSWNMRKLLSLKDVAMRLLTIRIGNGRTTLFWHDPWTTLGSLISYVGESGPRSFRLSSLANVSSATNAERWALPSARSDRQQELLTHLAALTPPTADGPTDQPLWKYGEDDYRTYF
ncbi:PREDICTED: uncharacterized protein LOC104810153 [Tarenaya hassleriana]|uniref:uncharacterized protein LOC104810153 n=1 Tax=Tarenaya hassleriana TaxID=28532 RepID=UPI00053C4BBE|nr:PREDICTED: uncharacterized protein LOC104810153 [Tarenaya hassleriana]